jgi:hypothetical protein
MMLESLVFSYQYSTGREARYRLATRIEEDPEKDPLEIDESIVWKRE